MNEDVREVVIKLIAMHMGLQGSDIRDELSFVGDLGCDSLDMVELVMTLEDEFALEADDDDLQKLSTVGEAISYIEQLRQEQR